MYSITMTFFGPCMRRCRTADVDYLTGAQVTRLETGAALGQVEFQHDGVVKKRRRRLLVLADGGRLTGQIEGVTQHVHDYQQWAVVARVRTERFT